MQRRAEALGRPSDGRVTVTVLAAESDALETLRILSGQLGITPDAVLRKAPFTLDVLAPQGSRARVVAMLQALGVTVRLDDPAVDAPLALSARPEIWAKREDLAAPLAPLVGLPVGQVTAALASPGGLVLPAMPPQEAERLRRAIRRIRGLSVTLSDPSTAIYDLFALAGPPAALTHHLRLIGQTGDGMTGALAAGLDRRLCQHLGKRFAAPGLMFIDRAFQRFDILLTGTGRWVSAELADFLTGRTALPRARFETISPENPIRIEVGLTRTAAIQFHADYAAIGLETRLVLTGADNA